jgi:molecular chaperone GrpE
MTDDPYVLPEGDPASPQAPDPTTASAEVSPATAPGPDEASQLREERDRYYDLLLRKTAEFDNYRKRTERERREQAERATAELLLEVLPIVDDLERALAAEAAAGPVEQYRKGVELIHRRTLDLLRSRSVQPIEALGADFDPNLHQAVIAEPSEGRREGEVIEEFRRGYRIGDRLLRPAMVKVARG